MLKDLRRLPHQAAAFAVLLAVAAYFTVGLLSDEGRFRSFADSLYSHLGAELQPIVTDLMRNQGHGSRSEQWHQAIWRKSTHSSGDDNSWGTYFHTIMVYFNDEPARILLIKIELQFQQMPEGYASQSGRSKGWVRFGDAKVGATMSFGVLGREKQTDEVRTALPHRDLSPTKVEILADRATAAVYR